MYLSIFARNPIRMLSHLGYKLSSGNCVNGILVYPRVTVQIKKLLNKCGGMVPMHPGRAGPNHSNSCGTPRIGDAHLLE
jgi:hypothetical protein